LISSSSSFHIILPEAFSSSLHCLSLKPLTFSLFSTLPQPPATAMFSFNTFTLALSFVASVSAVAIPRATQPSTYNSNVLEAYNTYHTRYMALSCNTKHTTAFFDQCCHPLLKSESLSSRPAECDPDAADDSDDDLPFCDDDDDSSDSDATTSAAPVTTAKASSTVKPKTTTTQAAVQKPAATPKATPKPATSSASSTTETGGVATFFYQNGVAGACGTVHSDSAMIAAIDADRYGDTGKVSSLCGKQVQITNTKNKKSVTVTIADACPTCENSNSIDLSVAAFKSIATLDEGEVPITWNFL